MWIGTPTQNEKTCFKVGVLNPLLPDEPEGHPRPSHLLICNVKSQNQDLEVV
jgi:hypothetical protein